MLLLGRFHYGPRGILDLTHTRLFTFASVRHLFEQAGFMVDEVRGIPAPFSFALGENAVRARIICDQPAVDPCLAVALRVPDLYGGAAASYARAPARTGGGDQPLADRRNAAFLRSSWPAGPDRGPQ